jgi:DNA (cytosine-5)-methyltransferase 1
MEGLPLERPIVYATVCSGIEAMSEAVKLLKWKPQWFSETAPAPCAVLAHHYPNVPNLGDMTKIRGKDYEGKIDLLAGGTPCQSFSNAGRKRGLADPRGQLSPAFARLAHDMRAPWLLWENVPGALWAERGESFAAILRAFMGRRVTVPRGGWKRAGGVAGARGKYSVAWRVLDAQYVCVDGFERAVPQQRKRLWLVGHRGDGAAPAAVLVGCARGRHVPCPVRVPKDRDTAPDAGSTRNPVSIGGNVITRKPDNKYVRRTKGWRVGSSFTLQAKQPTYICDGVGVRKMTPLECERLMGFPDGYTLVNGANGKPLSDTARWFMLGNSWAVNVARFVCDRIDKYIRGELDA